jgi:two-component system, chemotaxis family, chemotaxis protein CheY
MFPPTTRFLIADDMPVIRDLIKTQLRSMGYRTLIEAEDGQEAFDKVVLFHGNSEPIDVIISDWNMPKMTGLDFLKQIRSHEKFGKLPFILLTSESEKDQVTEAVLSGVSQYIIKPFQPKAFEEKLKAVWAKSQKKAA